MTPTHMKKPRPTRKRLEIRHQKPRTRALPKVRVNARNSALGRRKQMKSDCRNGRGRRIVLHCFQKKTQKTSKANLNLAPQRRRPKGRFPTARYSIWYCKAKSTHLVRLHFFPCSRSNPSSGRRNISIPSRCLTATPARCSVMFSRPPPVPSNPNIESNPMQNSFVVGRLDRAQAPSQAPHRPESTAA